MDVNARKVQSGDLRSVAPSECGGVHALVLVGGKPESERFGEFPLALLDVLGRSVLMRTLDRIHAAGVAGVTLLSDTDPLPYSRSVSCQFSVADSERFWDDALQKFRQLSSHSECVLVLRLGAWAEVDFAAMIRQHRDLGSAITRAYTAARQALDIFVISSGNQAEAAALLRGELHDERIATVVHHCDGYVNMLAIPADLRSLTLDAFAGECDIQPCGKELRPGVWVGRKAHIHRCARVVAPAFIGDSCCVQRDAVVTRGSSVEHHSEVDCATVIDNSNVMPFTRVGAGLDVEQSVVGFRQLHSVLRELTVTIEDPSLIGSTTTGPSAHLIAGLSWLLNLLPIIGWKLFFGPRTRTILGAPSEVMSPIPALTDAALAPVESQTKSYGEMTATRRYGNE